MAHLALHRLCSLDELALSIVELLRFFTILHHSESAEDHHTI
jgi:hypothetical protein